MKERTDAEILEKCKALWPEEYLSDTEYKIKRGSGLRRYHGTADV